MRHGVTIIKETKKRLYLISNEPIATDCSFVQAREAVESFKQALISEGYPVLAVCIPTELEIFGSWIYGYETSVSFKPFKFFRTRENRKHYLSNCWLGSPYFRHPCAFCAINLDGLASYCDIENTLLGVNPIIVLDKTKH